MAARAKTKADRMHKNEGRRFPASERPGVVQKPKACSNSKFNIFYYQLLFAHMGWGLPFFQTAQSLVELMEAQTMGILIQLLLLELLERGVPRAFFHYRRALRKR